MDAWVRIEELRDADTDRVDLASAPESIEQPVNDDRDTLVPGVSVEHPGLKRRAGAAPDVLEAVVGVA